MVGLKHHADNELDDDNSGVNNSDTSTVVRVLLYVCIIIEFHCS